MANTAIDKAGSFELAVCGTDFTEMIEGIAEELDGLGSIELTKVNVPNGGVTEFEVDGEDVAKIEGVVVARINTNAYFDAPFGEGDDRPACASDDGKVGVDRDGAMHNCASCPRNQWGANGKDCTNKVNLYILQAGELMPIHLILPPTSIKSWRDYVSKQVLGKGLGRTHNVVTEVTLEKTKGEKYTYSVAKFKVAEKLDKETRDSMKQYAESFSEFLKSQAANRQPAAVDDGDDVIEVPYEEIGVPF